MKCSVAKGLMSSYLDGEVTRSQLAQVDEHLQGCAECAALLFVGAADADAGRIAGAKSSAA